MCKRMGVCSNKTLFKKKTSDGLSCNLPIPILISRGEKSTLKIDFIKLHHDFTLTLNSVLFAGTKYL